MRWKKVRVKVAQLCLTLCDPMDYTVHGILQARILEWVAFPFSRGTSPPRNQTGSPALQADSLPAEPPPGKPKNTGVGGLSLLQRIFLTQELNQDWAIREAPKVVQSCLTLCDPMDKGSPRILEWVSYLFSIVYSCPFCWRLIDCRCVNLSLGFLFCPVNPYVCFCANTMLLWLLWLCSIVWSLGGLCLLLCSFFSGMLWQFWIFLWFHINFMITCSSSVKNVMGNLIVCGCVHAQLCLTLCDPMDCSLPGSFVHGLF